MKRLLIRTTVLFMLGLLIIGLVLTACKQEEEEPNVSTVVAEEESFPTGIAGNLIQELDANLTSAGYSDEQAEFICDGSISEVETEELDTSTDLATVAPVVLKGAITSLSDEGAQITTSNAKLSAIDIIIDSIAQSLNGRLTAASESSIINSPTTDISYISTQFHSSLGSVQAYIMKLLAGVAIQQLDDAGVPRNEILEAVKQVSRYLMKSCQKAGVAEEDLTSVARDVTEAAVGSVDETGLNEDQVESAIEAVVVGVMIGLNDYGADASKISEAADDIATGAADGLLDAGISTDNASGYISTITVAITTGASEAGLSDSEVNDIGLAVEDVTNDYISSFTFNIVIGRISGETTEIGGASTFSLKLSKQPISDVVFSLSSDNTYEGTVIPSSITFTPENWSDAQTVTVTGVNDEIDDGDQNFSILFSQIVSDDPNYNGMIIPSVLVKNVDDEQTIFGNPRVAITMNYGVGVAVGDFDNDNDLDIATVHNYKWDLVGINDGNANFSTIGLAMVDGRAGGIVVSDMNLDGFLDIAHCSGILYINDGAGGFISNSIPGGSDIVVGDLNGDNYPDIVIASTTSGVYFHNSGGDYILNQELPGGGTKSLAIADVDKDEDLDLGLSGVLYYNDGNGNLINSGENLGSSRGVFVDINNDGHLDFASTSVALNDGNGVFTKTGESLLGYNVAAGDINSDGYIDIVTTAPVNVYLGDGSGIFNYPVQKLPTGSAPTHNVALGDFNSDGKLDLVISTGSGTLCNCPGDPSVYLNIQ